MVRSASFDSNGMKKGAWSEEEDNNLRSHIQMYGHPNWQLLPILAGLSRCGKSCRLRWVNYLKPGLKRGNFTKHERDLIIKLHAQLGNKWSVIAANLPGRTDNEVKNYWHAHIHKRGLKKGNGAVNKVIKTQMLKQDQPSQINFCNINQTEPPSNHINIPKGLFVENLENMYVVSSAAQADQHNNVYIPQGLSFDQGNNLITEEFYQTCYGDLSPFEEGQLIDNFWSCKETQNKINMLTVFSESSGGAEFQLGDFLAEQRFGEEAISWYFGDIMDML